MEAPGALEVSAGGSTVEEAASSPVAAALFEPDPSPEQVCQCPALRQAEYMRPSGLHMYMRFSIEHSLLGHYSAISGNSTYLEFL